MTHFTRSFLLGNAADYSGAFVNWANYQQGVGPTTTGQPTGSVTAYPDYHGWQVWSGPSGMGRSTYNAFFARTTKTAPATTLQVGGTQHDGGSLAAIQAKIDAYGDDPLRNQQITALQKAQAALFKLPGQSDQPEAQTTSVPGRLIVCGVVVLGIAGFLYWKFRK